MIGDDSARATSASVLSVSEKEGTTGMISIL